MTRSLVSQGPPCLLPRPPAEGARCTGQHPEGPPGSSPADVRGEHGVHGGGHLGWDVVGFPCRKEDVRIWP